MKEPTTAFWTDQDLINALPDFMRVYENRPLKTNKGGMEIQHAFFAWFTARWLRPEAIIESGVFKGQGTWFLHQGHSDAEIFALDPKPQLREVTIEGAHYLDSDFSRCDWTQINAANSLVLFDDHQNSLERVKQALWFGFRHILIDDNYCPGRGDNYSLKEAMLGAGHSHPRSIRRKLGDLLRSLRGWQTSTDNIRPNISDRVYLLRNVDYYEFPPVYLSERNRWGDHWSDTKQPLMASPPKPFIEQAASYTWMCYVSG